MDMVVKETMKAAEQGDADAQNRLGRMYTNGQGVSQDYQQAVTWYRKAADQGRASGQNNLGRMYENGRGVPQDYQQAVTWYRKAADQGHADAQNRLGRMYENGQGVSQDYQQAVTWYRKAADQGHASGQNNLGRMYENGRGVPQDHAQAAAWYQKAADQGDADAQNRLGVMYENGWGVPQDHAQAAAWYQKAADQGNARGQKNLGWMYTNGQGVSQDYQQAVTWYRKAADQGNADAQTNLGWMYENGRGVPQDHAQAAAWYQKAADQGNADAQNNLGVMYQNGWGVSQDYQQAVTWYRKAADQGNAWGQTNLGGMYENGWGVPQDHAQAAAWYQKAADQGNAWGQNNLGVMYQNGWGVPQDHAQAAAWYRKAAEQGNELAKNNLGVMFQEGRDVPQDEASRYRSAQAELASKAIEPITPYLQLLKDYNPQELKSDLVCRVKGQNQSIDDIVRAVSMSIRKRCLKKEPIQKPIAVFLAVGPTGVGKTETGKALAAAMARQAPGYSSLTFAMGEFSTKEMAVRLTGSAPGYIGSEQGGQLTQAMMQNPFRVVLFDEIEKADHSILPLFLNIFDEGWLAEAATNRQADFSASIIILTSNLANEEIAKIVANPSLSEQQKELHIKTLLQGNGLSPEFLGRIDKVLAYARLDDAALIAIIEDLLKGYEKDPSTAAVLLKKYKPSVAFGVRELVRKVEADILGYGEVTSLEAPKEAIENISQKDAFAFLMKRITGQEAALRTIANHLYVNAQKKLDQPSDKPIAVFLAVGPSGVGKTETAKALAEYMAAIHKGYGLIALDMSEFYQSHTVASLIGSPTGYIGSDQPGRLTGAMRDNPYRVVLFDEIEKAYHTVTDIFLQIFDEGRLSDASMGFQARFDKSVIVLTSNLANEAIGEIIAAEGEPAAKDKRVLDTLRDAGIRGEILARVNAILPYRPLDEEDYLAIVEGYLRSLPEKRRPDDIHGLAQGVVAECRPLMSYGVRVLMKVAEKRIYAEPAYNQLQS